MVQCWEGDCVTEQCSVGRVTVSLSSAVLGG
jgi:hypothetical protein